jgi:transketolase
MALTKLRPYWSGFLIFSDYARGAIRLSALMEIPVLHIFTHDSIGVGQDGPTHQPVEQLVSLRAVPGLLVFRPADANEVVEMWRTVAVLHHEPAALILTRQPLPTLDRSRMAPASGLARGAYVLADPPDGKPQIILVATGSEVHLALAARDELEAEGMPTRVVSMLCWELFDRQPQDTATRSSHPRCGPGSRSNKLRPWDGIGTWATGGRWSACTPSELRPR